jgi:hypothetical protein
MFTRLPRFQTQCRASLGETGVSGCGRSCYGGAAGDVFERTARRAGSRHSAFCAVDGWEIAFFVSPTIAP